MLFYILYTSFVMCLQDFCAFLDIKQSIKVLSISSKDELPSSSHDTLLVELHTKMNSVLDHVREIEHKLDIYIQKPQLELFSSASDSPQFPPPPAVSPQLTLPPAMSSQFPPPPATTSQFPPPPATTSQFPPPPATSSQFPPPPATTSQFPPPPATTSQFPPPPATSSQFPTPPATSSQLPPPPATSSQFPPPPATSSQLPPPPATTSQFPPPPATSSQFPPPPATSPQLPPPPATTSQLPPPPATSSQFPPPPATSPQFTLPQFPPPPALSSTSPQFSPPYASSCASSSLMAESLVNEFLHEDFTEFLRSAASYSESLPGGRSLSPMAESFRSEPVTPTKVENPPPPPFSTPPRLRPVRDAVAMVPGTDNSSLRKLTIAIARESIFGPKEMDTMTLSGRNNTIVFDRTKLDYIERIVYNRVSDRKGQGEFELIWSQCLNSLTKACQNLRKKYPIIID